MLSEFNGKKILKSLDLQKNVHVLRRNAALISPEYNRKHNAYVVLECETGAQGNESEGDESDDSETTVKSTISNPNPTPAEKKAKKEEAKKKAEREKEREKLKAIRALREADAKAEQAKDPTSPVKKKLKSQEGNQPEKGGAQEPKKKSKGKQTASMPDTDTNPPHQGAMKTPPAKAKAADTKGKGKGKGKDVGSAEKSEEGGACSADDGPWEG